MKTSNLIAIVVALSSPVFWCDAADLDAEKKSQPNVIVLVADDLGYADFSRSKHSRDDVKTPHLDALMAAGTSFSNAYATSPICNPSRSGLITGTQQQRWGTYWYGSPGLPALEPTIPKTFKSMGYITKKIGKTHLGRSPVRHPLDHGFDEFLGFEASTWDYTRLSQLDVEAYQKRNGGRPIGMLHVGPLQRNRGEEVDFGYDYTSDVFGDEAIELINRDRGGKPFYIQLEFNAVHLPTYVTDEKYSKMVGLEHEPWNREAEDWKFPYWDPNKQSWGTWHKAWGNLEEIDRNGRKRYLSHLVGMDENIGRILAAVAKSGQTKNTIVVFLSDNGGTINTYSCNAPLRGYKFMFGEGGIRVPMTISWPGHLPKNQTADALVSAMDIFPTIAELAGGNTPEGRDGRSLVGLINGERATPHEFLCFTNGRGSWAIRKGDWKLSNGTGWEHANFKYDEHGLCIRDDNPFTYPAGVHLFNVKDDISETTSLTDAHPEVVAELTKLYQDWRSQMAYTKNEGGIRKEATVGEWNSPFDGKTLRGWKQYVGTAQFTVEDGTIVGRSRAGSLSSYLCSEAVYEDFELEFEVKCDTGLNSGFQLRTRQITAEDVAPQKQKMVGRVFGPQVEIESSPGQAGYIYGQGMGGWLSAVPKQKDEAARSHAHYQNDKWNQFRVLAQGPRIQTFVNGQPIADLNDPGSFKTHPKGFIGLQVHMVGRNQGANKVSWRNIRIRELKTSTPEPATTSGKSN